MTRTTPPARGLVEAVLQHVVERVGGQVVDVCLVVLLVPLEVALDELQVRHHRVVNRDDLHLTFVQLGPERD